MEQLTYNIAQNLKCLRKTRKMSFDELSEETGVSKSMLAQIERGEANPTIGILGRIAKGLSVDIEQLLQAPTAKNFLMSIRDMQPSNEQPGKYKIYTCFPNEDTCVFKIQRIEIEPGKAYRRSTNRRTTKEYILVADGQVDIEVENKKYSVTTEETFQCETDQAHIYRNPLGKRAICYIFCKNTK